MEMIDMSIELWAPDDYAAAAAAWQGGWGDLPYTARGHSVPPLVALGVLAHAEFARLDDLRHTLRASRVRRMWGRDVLAAVDRMLTDVGDAAGLRHYQQVVLEPWEQRLLAVGRRDLDRAELIAGVAPSPVAPVSLP